MSNIESGGGISIGPLNMRQFNKKYFDSYSEAEIWMLNTTEANDQIIRKEGGKYYIFIEGNLQDK